MKNMMKEEKIKKYLELLSRFEPDQTWLDAARSDLERVMRKNQVSVNAKSLGFSLIFRHVRFAAIPVLIAGFIALGGVAWASQESLPGDVFWPVKITTEEIQKLLTRDEAKKAELHMKFAEERLDETTKLIGEGTANGENISMALKRFELDVNAGRDLVVKLEAQHKRDDEVFKLALRLEGNLSNHQEVLDLMGSLVPDAAKPVIGRAKELSAAGQDVALKVVVRTDRKNNVTELKIKVKENENKNEGPEEDEEELSLSSIGARKRAEEKIRAVTYKLDELENHIEKMREKFGDNAVSEAEDKLADAGACLEEANGLLENEKFVEAFEKAHECMRLIITIKLETIGDSSWFDFEVEEDTDVEDKDLFENGDKRVEQGDQKIDMV